MTDMSAADITAMQALLATLTPELVLPGHVLVRQGDASDAAYYLSAGSVRIQTETPYGPVPLATLNAPRLIGEIGVLADMPRTASIAADTACRVYRLERDALVRLGRDAPDVLLSVIGTLGRQINAVNQTLGLYTNALAALERHSFDPQILTDLANPPPQLAGFAATFKRFATEIQSKRRHQDELASAALIQQSLLPSAASLPDAHGVRLFARMRAARDVGGDFYDHVRLDDRRLAIAIGDVCGKGIPASLFMAVVVTTLRTAARDSASVADTVRRAASLLARDNVASMFATSVFGVIDLVTGDVDYANCGHNPPLVLRRGAVVTTLPSTGLPLGLFESPAPSVAHTRLEPGDALVLYTDGVTEAQGPSTVEFGDERLVAAVSGGTTDDPETIVGRVFDAVDRFVDGAEPFDDITCLAVCR